MGTACLNQAGQGAVLCTVLRGAGNLTASVAGLRTVSRAEYLYNAVMRAVDEVARHVPWPFPGDSFPGDPGAVVRPTVARNTAVD